MKKFLLLTALLALNAQADNFALKLYQQLRQTPGNLFFSPASIEAALEMVAEGSAGTTREQFFQCLENPDGHFPKVGNSVTLESANAIWVDQNFPIFGNFEQVVTEKHGAEIRHADFEGQPETERKAINRWVEIKTRDKIKNLLAPGSVSASVNMILVNAIYFKGDWLRAFDPTKTSEEFFQTLENGSIKVPMMHLKTGRLTYGENEFFQTLELPYEGEEVSMLLILPKGTNEVNSLDQLPAARNTEVEVFLPRFKIESTFSSLKKYLAVLGLTDAFNPSKADFSGISPVPLFLSDAVHKAFVEVKEEGTEAAAATGLIMRATAMPPPPKVFRADHPFVFMIRENSSGKILFMGRVCNPVE